ncbi:MAG TPA: PVC-type heme-binding CxxCH protein [Acidobacteriota bacterium]
MIWWLLLFSGGRPPKPPYSPQEALRTFHLPPGFRIELVAAEPEVMDPVAMAFDERGRLFVVEMPDYPMGKQTGRVKLLEDKDGDGRFEHSTVFADDLHFPTGVMPWKGGVLVTCAPDILYLADTDGDNRADVRRVVLTGFAKLNPQLRVNGLQYGIDNWIYASYPKFGLPTIYMKEFGDQGTPIRFPDHPEIPAVDAFAKGMDIRFRLDPPALEAVAGNSQFGNAFDAWGNHFTVWNNDHIRHVVIQNQYLSANPYLAVRSAMQSISDHGGAAPVFPVTQAPLHMHESEIGHFTSACGISVYEGGSFPDEYAHSSFVCEPVHNLVHRDVLAPAGVTFAAQRGEEKKEFLASTDSWFRPVFTATGPDGGLYVVDFYRKIVEHPEWIPPEMMNEADLTAGSDRGRIYRIVQRSAKPGPLPDLRRAAAEDLVSLLSDKNIWWRLTAQRLLVQYQERAAIPKLQDVALRGSHEYGRMHALWTLQGLNALDGRLLLQALGDANPRIREQAVRLAEESRNQTGVAEKLLQMASDPDERVQFQLACTLGRLIVAPAGEGLLAGARGSEFSQSSSRMREDSDAFAEHVFQALYQIAVRHIDDSWFQIAALTSASQTAERWFRSLVADKEFTKTSGKGKEEFVRRVASIVGARMKSEEVGSIVTEASGEGETQWWCLASLDGLAEGLRRGGSERLELPATAQSRLLGLLEKQQPAALRKAALRVASAVRLAESSELREVVRRESAIALGDPNRLEERIHAAGILGLDRSGSTVSVLERFLVPQQPEPLQVAAVNALLNTRDSRVPSILLDRWRSYTPTVRDVVLAGFFNDRKRILLLLDAIKDGKVQGWSLGPVRKSQLVKFPDDEIRGRARALLSDDDSANRTQLWDKFRPVLKMRGDAARGHQVFEENCSKCHKIGSVGFDVGPDLKTIANRTRADILAQILNPNANIAPGYEDYMVETRDGRLITGVMIRQTANTVTLRRALGEEDTILRTMIADLRSLSVSQMPEDLAQAISVRGMADLLEFLKSLNQRQSSRKRGRL